MNGVIYLTPAAIAYLTEVILAVTITLYLASRFRHSAQRMQAGLLVSFFAVTSLFITLLFADVALVPSLRVYAVFAENAAIGLILIFLLQFAYHFPHLDRRKKWESLLVLLLTLIYTYFELRFAIFRYTALFSGTVHYRNWNADNYLAVGFLWVPIVFIRQAIYADPRRVSWFRKLWRPEGREARSARAFALVYLVVLALALIHILRTRSFIPTSVYQLILSAGLMFSLFAVAILYLNSLPERTSFMVKLAGVTLTIMLVILGGVGSTLGPIYGVGFRSALKSQQTLHFAPNAAGGYDITAAPYSFDAEPGDLLTFPEPSQISRVTLDYEVTFMGKTYKQVTITDTGVVGMGPRYNDQDLQYSYGTVPAIFALGARLTPELGGGVFVRDDGERLVITWKEVPFLFNMQALITFQVVLSPNGAFDLTYAAIPDNLVYSMDADPYENVWVIGVVPGNFRELPGRWNFQDVPITSASNGLVYDAYLDFRDYMHQLLSPLALLILVSSLLIVVAVPVILRVSIISPLNTLLDGVKQVDAGNRSIVMPIKSRDEIGYLTESFNGMIAQQAALIADLETRVAERTAELHQLAISDPLTNIFNRRHLLLLGKGLVEQAKRYNRFLSVIMLDVDNFKFVNDRYGHAVGDDLLVTLANYIQQNVRAADIAGRYGGDEFVLLMPETPAETALALVKRLEEGIEAIQFSAGTDTLSLSATAGIATLDPGSDMSIETLISRADQAMYAAKQAINHQTASS